MDGWWCGAHAACQADALLHGHSYTANPLACSAAVTALEAYKGMAHRLQDTGEGAREGGGLTYSPGLSPSRAMSSDHVSQSSVVVLVVCLPPPHADLWPEERVSALSRLPSVSRALSIGTVRREGGIQAPLQHLLPLPSFPSPSAFPPPPCVAAHCPCTACLPACLLLSQVLAVELRAEEAGYSSLASVSVVQELRRAGVYARPLGSVVYLMASFETQPATTASLLDKLEAALRRVGQQHEAEHGPAAVVI